jgi:bacterial leucyl aminopeptidase
MTGGMLGSGEVSRSYAEQGRKVRAVYHTDVVAFVKEGTEPRIGVISDNVDVELTKFMTRVIEEFGTSCSLGVPSLPASE